MTNFREGDTGFGFSNNIAAPNSFSLDGGGTKTFSNVFTDRSAEVLEMVARRQATH